MKIVRTLVAWIIIAFSISTPIKAQERKVAVTFKEDGNVKSIVYKIKLRVNDEEVEPQAHEKGFVFSKEIVADKVKVTVTIGSRDVDFGEVKKELFETDWVIGIDNKPYEKENVGHLPGHMREEGDILYYIEFHAEGRIKYKITIFK